MQIKKLNDGIFFISLGIILILCNIGILDWSVWWNLLSLWPVILIVWGLQLIFPKGPLALLSTLVILAAFVIAVTGFRGDVFPGGNRYAVNEKGFSEPYTAEIKDARLEIDAPATRLIIEAIKDEGGTVPQDLYRCLYRVSGRKPVLDYRLTSSSATVRFGEKVGKASLLMRPWFIRNNLIRFNLNPAVPWSIDIDTGASVIDLNLIGLNIEELSVEGGATSVDITFGEFVGDSRLELKSGVSSVNIKAPRSVGVQIDMESALSNKDIDRGFTKENSKYTSENYDSARGRLHISCSSALSSFEFEWID